MTFIWPSMFILLLLIPPMVTLYLVLGRRRQQLAARYGSLGFVEGAEGRRLSVRRHIPPAFFMLGIGILIVALARPQMVVDLPRLQGTVILAFDVSGSMAADDLEPTRMEAAKAAAREFVEGQPPGVQIGVVAFSDSGISVQPATGDQNLLLAAINRLTPQRGTSLANGIYASLTAIAAATSPEPPRYYSNLTPMPTPSPTPVPRGIYTPGVIVLLTDGENTTNPDPLEAAHVASDRGVRIYSVGIGSAEGTILEVNGFTVHTQLDAEALQQIAEISGGAYYPAENQEDLRKVYADLGQQLVVRSEAMEVTSIFVGAGIIALLVGGALSLLWFSRLP